MGCVARSGMGVLVFSLILKMEMSGTTACLGGAWSAKDTKSSETICTLHPTFTSYPALVPSRVLVLLSFFLSQGVWSMTEPPFETEGTARSQLRICTRPDSEPPRGVEAFGFPTS